MDLVKYLYDLNLPVTVITNCSLLHDIDLDELKKYIHFVTCSIDSVFEEPYCKVRGVRPETFRRVMDNLNLLNQHNVPHYFNSVITKFNTEEFVTGQYFDKTRELGVNSVSLTFVEDRSDVNYSLLPDRKTIEKICENVLDHIKKRNYPQIMLPPNTLSRS